MLKAPTLAITQNNNYLNVYFLDFQYLHLILKSDFHLLFFLREKNLQLVILLIGTI